MYNDFSGFTKENVGNYFKELSKEIKKELGRQANIELIVVGGASILLNYGFRQSTQDIDGFVATHSSIKDAINRVGDKFNLPNGWINSDFMQTLSFSPKLVQVSKPYKTYNQVLSVRTVSEEYLVAMKLASFRQYKTDSSDVIGIIKEQRDKDNPITFESVDKAVIILYGGWDNMPDKSKEFLIKALNPDLPQNVYDIAKSTEETNKTLLVNFEKKYPDVLKSENLESILDSIKNKSGNKTELFSRASQNAFAEKASEQSAKQLDVHNKDDISH